MTLWQRAKALCHRICVLLTREAVASARAIRGSWLLFLAMVIALLSWVGWMHERADKLERLGLLQQELHDYRDNSTMLKERIWDDVRQSRAALQSLIEAQRVGPRHTACDTKQILSDLRAQGVRLPAYPVEERCR